mmetsp:Transcript_28026/g.75701  ORF Transcript_28026/g.75701 Transcript_28026/m.75701 type:complete len:304 (-) Transcript_28026:2709-3620(-)
MSFSLPSTSGHCTRTLLGPECACRNSSSGCSTNSSPKPPVRARFASGWSPGIGGGASRGGMGGPPEEGGGMGGIPGMGGMPGMGGRGMPPIMPGIPIGGIPGIPMAPGGLMTGGAMGGIGGRCCICCCMPPAMWAWRAAATAPIPMGGGGGMPVCMPGRGMTPGPCCCWGMKGGRACCACWACLFCWMLATCWASSGPRCVTPSHATGRCVPEVSFSRMLSLTTCVTSSSVEPKISGRVLTRPIRLLVTSSSFALVVSLMREIMASRCSFHLGSMSDTRICSSISLMATSSPVMGDTANLVGS